MAEQQNTRGNPLAASSLARLMAAALPKSQSPQLKTSYDAVALAVHAGMIAVGFRLVGLGEDHKLDKTAEAEDTQSLPDEWNSSSTHSFRYAHAQSSMEYVVKVNQLGGKAVVFGMAVGDDRPASFDITVKDYISGSSVPATPITASTSEQEGIKALQDIFISPARLNDLSSLLKLSMIQKLAPGLQKEGYEEQTRTGDQEREQPNRPPPQDPEPARPHPFNDPLAIPPAPRRPLPEPIPGFEDEFEINRPRPGLYGDDRRPQGLGHNDLYPPGLGPHDPLRPHFAGGVPGTGPGFGGMHPTFDDPLFDGRRPAQGGGFDPLAPPGARYDPVGPGGAPRDGRIGSRFPGGFGGAPPNPFGGFGDGDFI